MRVGSIILYNTRVLVESPQIIRVFRYGGSPFTYIYLRDFINYQGYDNCKIQYDKVNNNIGGVFTYSCESRITPPPAAPLSNLQLTLLP